MLIEPCAMLGRGSGRVEGEENHRDPPFVFKMSFVKSTRSGTLNTRAERKYPSSLHTYFGGENVSNFPFCVYFFFLLVYFF